MLQKPRFQTWEELAKPPLPYRFTREEYYKLVDIGLLTGKHVELIQGTIFDFGPINDRHAACVGIVSQSLYQVFHDCCIRCRLPLSLLQDSDPEPDFAVVPGNPRDYIGKGHPTSALLVIEISDDEALHFDQNQKARLYASAGIADYWIVDLNRSIVETHRDPLNIGLSGWCYYSVARHDKSATIHPLVAPDRSIAVRDLLL